MSVPIALWKPLSALSPDDERTLLERGRARDPDIAAAVSGIIERVRRDGEAALRDMARRYDGAEPETLEVPRAAAEEALRGLEPGVRAGLERAAAAVAAFHRAQLPPPMEVEVAPGVRLGRRAEALRRVGVYAPGGRAAYPSSVLMGVVPARVAGVEEVVVCSPPGPDGRPPAAVLAACALAGADRVFALGGAGAVAAMALGAAGVPRVDRVVGPGNAYVTEAKRQLTGEVAIDCPAGPSEVLVVADATADAGRVALELLAQAEHDPDASAVAVLVGAKAAALADAVADELARLLPGQARREVIEAALRANGALLTTASLDDALRFAERYAPEHLSLMLAEPRAALERVRAAGTVFLGGAASVAFGDYLTGANHVLPTAGTARAYSGLSTLDFLRWSTYQLVDDDAAARLAGATATLAEAEGLPAHAAAARARASAEPASGLEPAASRSAGTAIPRRAAYAGLSTYDPGRLPTPVDLSDNTNLFGPPAGAAAALASASSQLTRYPSVYADALRARLARRHDTDPSRVTTGCGSDDVLDSAVRAFCEPGDVLARPDPTFGMAEVFARMNGVRPVAVPVEPGPRLPVDALLAVRPRVVYICRPDNPTGTLFARDDVEALGAALAGAGGVLLLDEAYADFAGESMVPWALAQPHVLVLRTLSKAFGLAGLRVGYGLGAAPLVAEVEKSRGPYKVSAPAEAAALAALEDGEAVAERVRATVAARDRLRGEVERRGLACTESAANFLLVKLPPGRPAAALASALRGRGVQVRPFAALAGIGEAIRVTAGPWALMQTFLEALDACLDDEGTAAGDGPR